MFKRVLSILFVICIILSLVGCGEAGPSKVVSTFLDAYKANDSEAASKVYMGALNDILKEDEMQSVLYDKTHEFDYSLLDETISESGETATVTVEIKAYALGEVFQKAMAELLIQGLSDLNSETKTSEKEMEELTLKELKDAKKTYIKTVDINLIKVNGEWRVKYEIGEGFLDAISGGMATILEGLENFSLGENKE